MHLYDITVPNYGFLVFHWSNYNLMSIISCKVPYTCTKSVCSNRCLKEMAYKPFVLVTSDLSVTCKE